MRYRAIGTENEFGIMIKDSSGRIAPSGPPGLFVKLDRRLPEAARSGGRLWFSNGGCIYVDMGHPEYASPEARSAKDALIYNKAGELLARRVFSSDGSGKLTYYLVKNNLGIVQGRSPAGSTFGFHESYMMRDWDVRQKALHRHLVPFLATRHIYGGSGWWISNDSYSGSQRALVMHKSVSGQTTTDRGIINTRREHHSRGRIKRLHLIVGDANMLEFAFFLKVGATSLVLSLMEDGHLFTRECINPLQVMHDSVYKEGVKLSLMRFEDGRSMNALEVQEMYLEMVKNYLNGTSFPSEEIEAESRLIVRHWEDALHAISIDDTSWMLGRLDHATKRWLAEREIKKRGITSAEDQFKIKKHIDIFYHGISNRSLIERVEQKWHDRRIVTDEQIQEAVYTPPSGTRAYLRGNFVRLVPKIDDSDIFVGWSEVRYENRSFNLKKPLIYRHDALEKYMMELESERETGG